MKPPSPAAEVFLPGIARKICVPFARPNDLKVWDAITSDRPYRQAWEKEKVIEFIQSPSGTHFEPRVVEMFMRVMSEA